MIFVGKNWMNKNVPDNETLIFILNHLLVLDLKTSWIVRFLSFSRIIQNLNLGKTTIQISKFKKI